MTTDIPTRSLSRRKLLASMPAAAAAMAPAAATALCTLPVEGADPIFAAIRHEREMKAAYDAANAHEDQLQASRPEGVYLDDNEAGFSAGLYQRNGHFKLLWVKDEESLYDAATAVAVKRELPLGGTVEEKSQHYGWKAWGDELKRWDAKLKEVEARRETSRKWREETGYDAAMQAINDAGERLHDAQKALFETQPTTLAGLMAFLDWLAANPSPDALDEYWEVAFETLTTSVRKLLAA
jgi:hypothetical protein